MSDGDGSVAPRTLSLREVLRAADRASEQVASWPKWKREVAAPQPQAQAEGDVGPEARYPVAIRGARVAAGLSLRALADRCGLSLVELGKYERGVREMDLLVSDRVYGAICAELDEQHRARMAGQPSLGEQLAERVASEQVGPETPENVGRAVGQASTSSEDEGT